MSGGVLATAIGTSLQGEQETSDVEMWQGSVIQRMNPPWCMKLKIGLCSFMMQSCYTGFRV